MLSPVSVWLRFENRLEARCLHSLGQLWRVTSNLGKGHACCCTPSGWPHPWRWRGGRGPEHRGACGTSSPEKHRLTKLRLKHQVLSAEQCAGILQALFCSQDQQRLWDPVREKRWAWGRSGGILKIFWFYALLTTVIKFVPFRLHLGSVTFFPQLILILRVAYCRLQVTRTLINLHFWVKFSGVCSPSGQVLLAPRFHWVPQWIMVCLWLVPLTEDSGYLLVMYPPVVFISKVPW